MDQETDRERQPSGPGGNEKGPANIRVEPKTGPLPKRAHFFSFSRWLGLFFLVALMAVGGYAFFTKGDKAPLLTVKQGHTTPAPPAVPVVAAAVKRGDFRVYLNGLGSVVPFQTVTLKSRVDGELMEVFFREGQMVNRGDMLITIDPRPFEVQLTQAEGTMARDEALLKNAQADLVRYRDLSQRNLIAKQQLDTQEALVRQYEGSLKSDQGQIDSARLQLTYSRITAPISGRVGLRLVDPGNIVRANDPNGLVVITQVQPITVVFPIPEDSLPQVLDKLNKGEQLTVEAYDREQKRRLAMGVLLTADNQIDPTTGTVRLKAVFPNEQNELYPNQFVNARLLVDVRRGATIIPAPAIQRGPEGTFVYIVKPDRTATVRSVNVGEIQGDEAIIRSGLAPGELVVVDGVERLREGSRLELREPAGRPAPKAS
jgi:multidrug efflux system membrane fusion protein